MFEIGVDIGGTNIKYGLVNEALEIVAHGSIPFPKTTAEDMADKLAAALRAMLAEQGVTVRAFLAGDREKMTPDAREMARRLEHCTEEERPVLERAVRFGLAALEGGDDR